MQRDQLLVVHSEISGVRRNIHQINTALEAHWVQQRREFEMMQANIRRIAVQPGFRLENNTTKNESGNRANGATPNVFTLGPYPRNLYLLWEEYDNGIGGRKPEKLVTREE